MIVSANTTAGGGLARHDHRRLARFEHFVATHAVVALDLRGHGESHQPDAGAVRYEVEALTRDVLAVVAAAGLSQPVAVGHSLGALIALECAAHHDALSAVAMVDLAPITNEAVKAYFHDSVATGLWAISTAQVRLGRVTVPVLPIGSAVPTNSSADLRTVCPTITIGQTVGAGHFNQLEVPEQVNAMIERFIAVNDLTARQA